MGIKIQRSKAEILNGRISSGNSMDKARNQRLVGMSVFYQVHKPEIILGYYLAVCLYTRFSVFLFFSFFKQSLLCHLG